MLEKKRKRTVKAGP